MTEHPTDRPSLSEQIQEGLQKIAPNARAIAVSVDEVVKRVGVAVVMANGVTQGFRYEGPLGDAQADLEGQLRAVLAPKS